MPEFQYVALNPQGSEIRGTVDAADRVGAAATLRRQRLLVMDLQDGAAQRNGTNADLSRQGLALRLASFLPTTTRDRILFLRQSSLMLRNGLTILQALEVSREQTVKRQFRAVLGEMSETIQGGHSFSEALSRHRRVFNDVTVNLVRSAEASGELDQALDRAAVNLERRQDLRRQLITSLTYPTIVVLTAIAVAVFMVWKIIPKFAAFFQRRGGSLPWSTQMLVDLSDYVTAYGVPILAGVLTAVGALVVAWLTPTGRRVLDRAVLRIPVVGKMLTVASMSQFGRTMSMLLDSGVTLLESLRITARVSGNRAFKSCFQEASEEILRGRDLAGSLRTPLVPRLVPHVIAVGERTGALTEVLGELGDFYEQEMQAQIKRMTALVEPAMILIIGGMVGFVYFSFFQAVFQLASG